MTECFTTPTKVVADTCRRCVAQMFREENYKLFLKYVMINIRTADTINLPKLEENSANVAVAA